jgi:hypothetical protein
VANKVDALFVLYLYVHVMCSRLSCSIHRTWLTTAGAGPRETTCRIHSSVRCRIARPWQGHSCVEHGSPPVLCSVYHSHVLHLGQRLRARLCLCTRALVRVA